MRDEDATLHLRVRLSPDLAAQLDAYVSEIESTRSDVVRMMLEAGLGNDLTRAGVESALKHAYARANEVFQREMKRALVRMQDQIEWEGEIE